MVCPSCGKYVAGAKALCKYCGAVLPYDVTPLCETHPAAGGGITTGGSAELAWPRRAATACLLLGLFSLVALPVVFALFYIIFPLVYIVLPHLWEPEVLMAVLEAIAGVVGISAILAGILALVLGGLAKVLVRRIEGTPFGADRTRRGMILGAIGLGIWILLIAIISLQKPRIYGGWSPIGGLRTINTAATTYASQYGHGFPLRLSYLAPPKLGRNGRYEDTDQAAGYIDQVLASGKIGGYRVCYVAGPVDSKGMVQSYTVYADPIDPKAGDVHYFTDQTGVIRQQSKRQANVNSPPIFQNY